jgi:DNA polymerase III subunit delta
MNSEKKNPADDLVKILRELKAGKIASSYLLLGESFQIREALNKIIAAILPEGDRAFNLFFMEPDQTDVDKLCEELIAAPLLPANKVVVVRQAAFLAPRQQPLRMLQQVREHLDRDPLRAAKDFMTFLGMAGWSLEDLRDGGWKRISQEEWSRVLDGEGDENRGKWLPRVLEVCVGRQLLPQRRKADTDRLEELLTSGLPDGNVLILTAESIDKRKRLIKILSETGRVLQFSAAKGETRGQSLLMDKTRELLERSGKSLAPAAWLALGRKTGFDLEASTRALEKLVAFTGERHQIRQEDIEQVIGKTKEDSVFDLTTALGDKLASKALTVLRELVGDQGVQPLVVLSMLVREIRFLLHARIFINSGRLRSWQTGMDYGQFQRQVIPEIKALAGAREEKGELGDLSDEHPYVVYQACRRAHRFSDATLIRCLQELAHLDVQMKTTGRDAHLLLEGFVLSFCFDKAEAIKV